MFNPERLLGQMLTGALGKSLGGRTAGKRGMGGMLGGSNAMKAQLGIGMIGVAMAAWDHYSKQSKPAAPAVAPVGQLASPPPPPPPPAAIAAPADATRPIPMMDLRRQEATLLIRAMIAAAAADGLIDDDERAGILQRAAELGDDAATLKFLQTELAAPVSAEQLIAQTPRSLANEVYSAALLAIDIDTQQERDWLDALARGLGIDDSTRQQLHQELGFA